MSQVINSLSTRVDYTATAGQTAFTYPFPIFTDSDIEVYQRSSGVDPESSDQLVLTTNFTVSGAGTDSGGTVTLVSAASAGDRVVIRSNIPHDRLTNFTVLGDFTASAINNQLNELTQMVKQLKTVKTDRFTEDAPEVNSPLVIQNAVDANHAVSKGQLDAHSFTAVSSDAPIVASIAALKALSTSSNTQAFVTGYYGANDGGGGHYVFDGSASAADNGGTIIAPTAGSGRWKLVWTNRLSVKQFGARGDGTTDDRTAIQAAIDVIEANAGGTVFFPASTYIVGNYIKVDAPGVTLLGDGMPACGNIFGNAQDQTLYGSWIKLKSSATVSAHPVSGTDYPIVWIQYPTDFTDTGARMGGGVSNLGIHGNRRASGVVNPSDASATTTNSQGIGLYVEGTRNQSFENLWIVMCADHGLKTVTGSGGVTKSFGGAWFNNLYLASNKNDGMRYQGGDCHFSLVVAGYNGSHGQYYVGSGSAVGCSSFDNFANGFVLDKHDISLNGCYALDNRDAGVKVAGGDHERITIDGCVMQDNGKDTALYDRERSGIYVQGTVMGGVISNNVTGNKTETATSGQQYGIYVHTSDSRIVVKDNAVASKVVDNQDEAKYDNSPTTEGTFAGGASHAASDVITLEKGVTVTVDAVSGGAVTQFTVDSDSAEGSVLRGEVLTQTSTTGSGTGFSLTVDDDNIEGHGVQDFYNASWNKTQEIFGGIAHLTDMAAVAYMRMDTEGNAGSDDLDTLNGGYAGQVVVLAPRDNARTVVVKDGTGNIKAAGDFSLTHSEDTWMGMFDGTNWLELSRSDNTA